MKDTPQQDRPEPVSRSWYFAYGVQIFQRDGMPLPYELRRALVAGEHFPLARLWLRLAEQDQAFQRRCGLEQRSVLLYWHEVTDPDLKQLDPALEEVFS